MVPHWHTNPAHARAFRGACAGQNHLSPLSLPVLGRVSHLHLALSPKALAAVKDATVKISCSDPLPWSHAHGKARRQNAKCRIQDFLHKCSSPKGLYDPHGSLAGPAPDLCRTCPRQPKRVRRNPSADVSPRKCFAHSYLRDPPRSASIRPPVRFRCNAGGTRGLQAASAVLLCPSGCPLWPKSAETPTSADSGAAASGKGRSKIALPQLLRFPEVATPRRSAQASKPLAWHITSS
jgi:hypothetical protein